MLDYLGKFLFKKENNNLLIFKKLLEMLSNKLDLIINKLELIIKL